LADQVDVIVVGGGLGGGLAAWQLTQYGKSVVLLEEGSRFDEAAARTGLWRHFCRRLAQRLGLASDAAERRRLTYYRPARGTEGRLRAVTIKLGRGLGGSSALYSAALGRLRRADFESDRRAPYGEPEALPNDWPIEFDAFRSYYRRVENLMRIRGERDPADPDDDSQARPAPPLGRAARQIQRVLERNGCAPYRLRVGIDYVKDCKECFGARCPWACKADGYNRAIQLAEENGGLKVETDARVLELYQGDTGVVVVFEDAGGIRQELSAHRVVLAAGALNSPLILSRSSRLWQGTQKPVMLGRGLMFHVSDLFMVMGPRWGKAGGPRKWLALRDYYNDGDVNAGEIQSTGYNCTTGLAISELRSRFPALARGPGLLLLDALRPFIWFGLLLIGEHQILATIAEDLPFARNHVREEAGRVVVSYVPSEALLRHSRHIRARLRAAFSPFRLVFVTQPGLPNWGHPMGTCRMGTDPATSVTTPEGRLHDHSNILVADASVFPSSGGTGPALTVGAHAIRVADIIAADLSWQHAEKLAVVALWSKPVPRPDRLPRLPAGLPETGEV
jgi:choline dehydrogenase-like flavoprotein